MDDCSNCRRYSKALEHERVLECYHASYFTAGMIVYCRPQMLWGVEFLDLLRDGDWPRDPVETGYSDSRAQRVSSKARFIPAAEFYAEISKRLKTAKDSGEALIWEAQHGLNEYDRLSPPAREALNYISGYRRRKQSFAQWCADQERKKIKA